ncbi:MAG: aldose epimerase family protein [Solirubrobacteraceae bacterium]
MKNASRATTSPSCGRSRGLRVAVLAAIVTLGASALALAREQGHARARAATASISSQPFGTVGGKPVRLYTLSNGHMRVRITNFGGIIQSIYVPDRFGRMSDVSLGFRNLAGYEANDVYPQKPGGSGTTYFGATIGRYANRIAGGMFTLDGKAYKLPVNNGPNTLHGGTQAWNEQFWSPAVIRTPGAVALSLTYTSPNGQDGFPGTVVANVTFTLGRQNALRIHYHATTDRPTVINMTNHSYFNLAGQASGSVLGQRLMINANRYTPTDKTQIPTGAIVPVAGTPLDFRHMKAIGRDINSSFPQLVLAHGYDHNFVLNRRRPGLVLAARAVDPLSGRELTAYTTEPGVQLYTSNYLVGDLAGTTGKTYRQSDGFTLETQHYPNSPNQPSFPSTTLNPGTPFDSTTVFQFGVSRR